MTKDYTKTGLEGAAGLEKLIKTFLEEKEPCTIDSYCAKQKHLSQVINVACISIDGNNKKDNHQSHIKNTVLKSFADVLIALENNISTAKSFEELHNIIFQNKIKGIGPLTIYDVAVRIGIYLKLQPEKVYLHAGTTIGAKSLLKSKTKSKTVSMDELSPWFKKYKYTCHEVENFLCVKKNDI